MKQGKQKRISRGLVWGLLALALILAVGGYRFASHLRPDMLVRTQGNEVGGTFRLNSMGESTVTESDFHGDWILMWFFDSNCPEKRCGPVLTSMDKAYVTLRGEGVPVSALAVSLNPLEETEALQNYVGPLTSHVIPFTATQNMLRAMTAAFHAPYEREGDYYRPAPRIVIMDPQFKYAGTVEADGNPDVLIARLRQLAKH